ncbi:hypothetical protein SEA_ODAY_93 [Gordonia phage ODay]|nr:hypothetical protein SEA_ODAY_93 [Gordonia phage ODay]
MPTPSLESLISQHKDEPWPMPACKCGEVCPEERQTDDFDAWHAAHVAEVIRQHHAVVVELPAAHKRKTLTTPNGQPYEVAVWDFPYAQVATVVGSAEDGPVINMDLVYPLNAADFEALGLALLAAARLAADGAEVAP